MANTTQRMTLATALVRQYDNLVQEEIGARYAYEMARSRPQQAQAVVNDTAQYEAKLKGAQWQIAQMEKMVERITGMGVETLRHMADNLVTVLTRREEVAAELRNRVYLTPALRTALVSKGELTAEESDALEKLDAAIEEVSQLRDHLAELDRLAAEIARQIAYNDASEIQVVSSLVGV